MVKNKVRSIKRRLARTPKKGVNVNKGSIKRNPALIKFLKERRVISDYACYSSTLGSLTSSLGLNVANEIRVRGCRNVLDLGCGKATALEELHAGIPQTKFHGLTFVEEPEFAKLRRKGIDIKIGDWKNIKTIFGENSMDFIYLNYGVEHSLNVKRDLIQISRVLRPGGRVLFNVNAAGHHLLRELNPALKTSKLRLVAELPAIYTAWMQKVGKDGFRMGAKKRRSAPGIAFYLEKTK